MARNTRQSATINSMSCPILVGTKNPELKFLLDKPKFTFGRIYTSYSIRDDTISRLHCSFILEDGVWTLHNFSSSGTFINGCALKPRKSRALFDKDVIRFGPRKINTFMFHADRRNYEDTVTQEPPRDDHEESDKTQEKGHNGSCDSNAMKRKIKALEKDVTEKNEQIRTLEETVQRLKDKEDKLVEVKDNLHEDCQAKLKAVKRSLRHHRSGHTNMKEQVSFIADVVEAELMCTICNELMYDAVSVNCGHMFCNYCLSEWKNKNILCPLCRVAMTSDAPAHAVNSLLCKLVPTLPDVMKRARRRLIEERGGQESDLNQLKLFDVVDLTEEDVQQRDSLHRSVPPNIASCAAAFVDLTEGNDFLRMVNMTVSVDDMEVDGM